MNRLTTNWISIIVFCLAASLTSKESLAQYSATLTRTESQGVMIIKKDGSTVPLGRPKYRDEYIEIRLPSKEKVNVDYDDIVGYLYPNTETVIHRRPYLEDDGSTSERVEYLEKKLSGTINVFERVIVTAGTPGGPGYAGSPGSVVRILLLEKGDAYKRVDESGGGFLKKRSDGGIVALKEFVSDQPTLIKELESEELKFDVEKILEIVNEYNVGKFTDKCEASCSKSTVIFYSNVRRPGGKQLELIIKDSDRHSIPLNNTLAVQLCKDHTSKVCVTDGENNVCTLLTGSPYFMSYYEVKFRGARDKLTLEKSSQRESQEFLAEVRNR